MFERVASGAHRKCTIARNADAGNPVKAFPQGKAWFSPARLAWCGVWGVCMTQCGVTVATHSAPRPGRSYGLLSRLRNQYPINRC